jgi:uncharacterized OB-fold protein
VSDAAAPGLTLRKCLVCHVRFVPLDGPCPKCAATETEPYAAPPVGTVLASTALEVPPAGWPAPHPLALVEVEDGVRLLVISELPLPAPGTRVEIRFDGTVYRATGPGSARGPRGEGDAPEAGAARTSL